MEFNNEISAGVYESEEEHIRHYVSQLIHLECCIEKIMQDTDNYNVEFERHPIHRGVVRICGGERVKADRYVVHIQKKHSKPRNRIFIISGTHGPEFFTGNDVHKHILENADYFLSRSCDIVLISNMNPFGSLNCTRPDSASIDYNRNGLTVTEPQAAKKFPNARFSKNAEKIKKITFISQKGITASLFSKMIFFYKIIKLVFVLGRDFTTATLGGQSLDADIPFSYSGQNTADGVSFCMDVISRYSEGIEHAYVIDVHTGLPGGNNILITLDGQSKSEADRIATGLKGVESVQFPLSDRVLDIYRGKTAGGSIIYHVNGTLIQTAINMSKAWKTTGIIIEMKGMNSSTATFLAVFMSNVMVIQGRLGIEIKRENREKIMRDMKKIFYPPDKLWHQRTIQTIESIIKKIAATR